MFGTSFGNSASSASSGGAFAPSDIAGLKLWLDADAANVNTGSPTNLDSVSTWVDKSTAANNATQSTATNQPRWNISGGSNGTSFIDFDGSSDYLSSVDFSPDVLSAGNQTFTFLSVFKLNSLTGANQMIVGLSSTGDNYNRFEFRESTTGELRFIIRESLADGGDYTRPEVSASADTGWHYILWTFDNDIFNCWLDGVKVINNASQGLDEILPQSFTLGALAASSVLFNADCSISECISYNNVVTAGQISNLDSYINTKYALPFTPSNLNPLLWLDAGVSASSSLWANQGSGATNATQNTAVNQPTYNATGFGTNSKPYFEFDGDNDFFTLGNVDYSKLPNHTIFVVCERASTDRAGLSGDINSGGQTTSVGSLFEFNSSNLRAFYGDSLSLTNTQSSETFTTGTTYIVSTNFSSGTKGEVLRSNGSGLTETITGTADTISGTKSNFSIGRWGDLDSLYFNGKIAEVLIFSSSLSVTDTESIETYLNTKYAAY